MDRSRFNLASCPRIGIVALAVLALGFGAALLTSGPARAVGSADFRFSPTTPVVGEAVTFTAVAQAAPGATYAWDLDGVGTGASAFETKSGTSPTATRTYQSPATLTVRLQVKDSVAPKTVVVKHTITIAARAPTASFTFAPAAPLTGQPVQFTSTSTDDGTLTEQVWDLNGDGTYDNGAGPTALRTFAEAGSYVVGLRVTDNSGLKAFFSQTIIVRAAAGSAGPKTQVQALRLMSPFPVVRIAGRIRSDGTRIRLLRVDAPALAKISIRCSGRGCPFAKQVRVSGRPGARAASNVRVRSLERLLRPGVRIRIYVTKSGAIGKYTRFKIRRGKAPARVDRCVKPGSWLPVHCPSS